MSAASKPVASTLSSVRWLPALAVLLAIAACSAPAGSPGSTTGSDNPDVPAGQRGYAGLGLEELRERGRLALREQRIYAPAGDNAMEYYVALRDGSKGGDDSADNALMELQPYAVIAAEQALARKDFKEAERLHKLLAAADPRAPSLARIGSAITSGLLGVTREAAQDQAVAAEAETVVAAPLANASLGSPAPAPAPAAVAASSPTAVAPVTPAPPVAVSAPTDSRPPPATVANRQPTAAPVDTLARAELVALRTPQPEYPEEKRQKGAAGKVVASFTVNSDGTVGEVRTESIGSRHISFERSVARAVKRWKYQPPGESRSVTQSFSFAP